MRVGLEAALVFDARIPGEEGLPRASERTREGQDRDGSQQQVQGSHPAVFAAAEALRSWPGIGAARRRDQPPKSSNAIMSFSTPMSSSMFWTALFIIGGPHM